MGRAAEEQKPLDLDALNQSELTMLAKEVLVDAHRGMPRAELIALIRDGVVPEAAPRLLNKMRLKIMQYVNENFEQLECLLSCPAKSRDPYACFQCSDLQVASCTLENEKMFTDSPDPEESGTKESEDDTMPNTVKIQSPSGEQDIQVLSEEEIDRLLDDKTPASRSTIMEHMKMLGKPIGELIKMMRDERKAFILERYAELGVSAGAKKPKGQGGGATVTQLKPAQAARKAEVSSAASVKTTKAAAPSKAEAEQASGDLESAALGSLLAAQRETIEALTGLVEAQGQKIDNLIAQLENVSKIVFDTHFIVRTALPMAAGLSEDDVVEAGNANGVYGRLLAAEVEEDVEGND